MVSNNTFTINRSSYHLGLVNKACDSSGLTRSQVVSEGLRLLWAVNKRNLKDGYDLELTDRKEGVRYRSKRQVAVQAHLSGEELVIAKDLLSKGYAETKSDVVKLALQCYSQVRL